ncbi:hypothetical protein AYO20_01307 [Fonsecaea nubica]|uniref:Cyclase n=1 Tax=Fonsecaea nubica TaxID=856822 RepID=A0A178DCQ8_9EURO|nr:hypothetical protein AYO20_01307 [Fonsecaea nubica]OAL39437.1 hypothetical protein AYO20_01307 [Fonsecaea nubica]
MSFDPDSDSLPKRAELPDIPGAPKGAAWFWGKDDELGRLNLLTPRRRREAAKLVESGETVNLDWPLNLPNPPAFGREPFEWKVKSLGPAGNDDLYQMNSQSGSQWDGFRHVSIANGGGHVFYNNLTQDEIMNTTRCGIQAWADHGIVGRGVLIDYWSYALQNNKKYDPNETHPISTSELLACAKAQGLTFQYGDILMIRTGWIDNYQRLDQDRRASIAKGTGVYDFKFVGVEVSEEMVDFLHDNYFAAVASDSPAFESWPTPYDWNHHLYLLPRWGCPIGEMWDFEKLADACKRHGRYHFFFVSSPSNVPGKALPPLPNAREHSAHMSHFPGGVGSHPNAMAIF